MANVNRPPWKVKIPKLKRPRRRKLTSYRKLRSNYSVRAVRPIKSSRSIKAKR